MTPSDLIASSLDDYLAAPIGRCFFGRSFAHFYPTTGFNGFRLWGAPDGDDIAALTAALDVTKREGTVPYLSFIDLGLMERVEPVVFQRMSAYQASRMASYASLIRRQALVKPAGIVGAIIAGFYHHLAPTFPVAVFATVAESLEWLGWAGGRAWYERFHELWSATAGAPSGVRDLRLYLDANLDATLAASARDLQLTARTLQRRLTEAGTSFQAEVNAARVRAAKARMLGSEETLSAIARQVGCGSLQHFSTVFRKVTGETPSAWRARQR